MLTQFLSSIYLPEPKNYDSCEGYASATVTHTTHTFGLFIFSALTIFCPLINRISTPRLYQPYFSFFLGRSNLPFHLIEATFAYGAARLFGEVVLSASSNLPLKYCQQFGSYGEFLASLES